MFLVKVPRLYFERYGCSRWNSVFFAGCFMECITISPMSINWNNLNLKINVKMLALC